MNGRPDHNYREAIRLAAGRSHSGPFLNGPLYSRIVWFHKGSAHQGDVDNIAKRIHDA
jgi:Holliday junction resolvase RusA-like endonuclease